MKILLIYAAADWSTIDQSTGYEAALKTLGHEVKVFRLNKRIEFWHEALQHWGSIQNPPQADVPIEIVLREACYWALVEAAKFKPHLVLVTSAMGFHPDALVMLEDAGYPVALALSESPYDDIHHAHLAPLVSWVFTNDKTSVDVLSPFNPRTTYLPTAYSESAHHPGLSMPGNANETDPDCDILFVGTGFPERERFLEAAIQDPAWPSTATFHMFGFFGWAHNDMSLGEEAGWTDSPLFPYAREPITNDETAARYCHAKVVLNFYRDGAGYSMNPRAYEIAACGAFQLAQDSVPEAHNVFSDTIGYFSTPHDLAVQLSHWLDPQNETKRNLRAQRAHEKVRLHTYTNRARTLLEVVKSDIGDPDAPDIPESLTLTDSTSLKFGAELKGSNP